MNAVLTVSPLFKYSIGLIQYTYAYIVDDRDKKSAFWGKRDN